MLSLSRNSLKNGLFGLLLIINALEGLQQAAAQELRFVLKDKITSGPVEYAHVRAYSSDGIIAGSVISDSSGMVILNARLPVVVEISCLGFKTSFDTINSDNRKTILLAPDHYQLDRVVITAQFRPQPVDQSIYKVNIIDHKEIGLKAANNLGDLLRNEGRFQYSSDAFYGDFIRIRGLTGEHVKILVNGLPVTGRMADRLELGQLNLYNVKQIEYIEGPVSVIYGSNALAGAINIITLDQPVKDFSAGADLYYETAGIYDLNAFVTHKAGRNAYSVNAARNFFSGWSPNDSSRNKVFKPRLQYIAGGSWMYQHKDLKIQWESDIMNEQLRDLDSLRLDYLYEKALDAYHFTTRWNNRLNLINKYHDDFVVNVQAGYSYYRKKKITYLNDLVNLVKNPVEGTELHDTATFHLINTRAFVSNITGKKFEYQSGIDISAEGASGKRIDGRKSIADAAVFSNFIYRPFRKLSLQPGLRYQYNTLFRAPLIYAFNVKWDPGDLVIRSSYAKGFKAPSLKQLYLEFIDINHEVFGNPGLRPETGNSFNISAGYSMKWRKQAAEISLSLYHNTIENAIQLVIDTQRPGWATYINLSDHQLITKGADVQAQYFIFPRFVFDAGLYLNAKNRIDQPEKFLFANDLSAGVRYTSPRFNYEIAAFYKYTDNFTELAGNFNPAGGLDGIAERIAEDYHNLDISISKNFRKPGLTVSAGVKNLFNVTLIETYGNLNFHGGQGNSAPAGYGRTFYMKLQYQLERNMP